MRIIFFSKFYPRQKRDFYLRKSRHGLASAADAHQYALAKGFNSVCEDFCVVNMPALYPFPTQSSQLYSKDGIVSENGLMIRNIGFLNLVFMQTASRYLSGKRALEKIIKENNDEISYIIIYSTNYAFLQAAVDIKRKYENVRLCMIVPDIPEDMKKKSILGNISDGINGLGFASFDTYCKKMDSFVLLSRYMEEKIPSAKGRNIVSEGIYDDTDSQRTPNYNHTDKFIILYSGLLDRKFGVMNLVEAVNGIDDDNINLHLYGAGDSVEAIKKFSSYDSRIEYKGIISRNDVLQKQSDASLLVNPRVPDNNPFTRYSFPSKTMEYLASGTPTLLYELDGIPKEYYEYCYHLAPINTSVEDLKNKILDIKKTPWEERISLAKKARDFILKEKSAEAMCSKIYSFLKTTVEV